MNKIILKTSLVTLASLILLSALVFGLWILISPQTMATSCENTGNFSLAVTCADLRYKYTKDVNDLARCAQDSISAKKDKLVVKYCELLISDEGFEKLCEVKDKQIADTQYGEYAKSYKSYIFGNLAVSVYRTGDFDKALEYAKDGNSFNKLAVEVIENGTRVHARKILAELDGSDKRLIELLEEFITKGV